MNEIFREGVEWPWDDLITFLVNSEKPRDVAMRNTGRGLLCFSTTACYYYYYYYYYYYEYHNTGVYVKCTVTDLISVDSHQYAEYDLRDKNCQ